MRARLRTQPRGEQRGPTAQPAFRQALLAAALAIGGFGTTTSAAVEPRTALLLAADRGIVVLSQRGRVVRRLTTSQGDSEPAWSPDGTRIAFVRRGRVVVMNADGSGIRSVGAGGSPSWSPDGERLAVERGASVWEVTLRPDGRIRAVGSGADPSWSSRGHVALVREIDGVRELYAAGLRLLPGVPAAEPSWSPDASRIAFSAHGGSSCSSSPPACCSS